MYRLRCYASDVADLVMGIIDFVHSIIVGVIDVAAIELFGVADRPAFWGRIKVAGLIVLTLIYAGATIVVYTLSGPEGSVARALGTTWFMLCTVTAVLVYIFYFRLKAEEDALMG